MTFIKGFIKSSLKPTGHLDEFYYEFEDETSINVDNIEKYEQLHNDISKEFFKYKITMTNGEVYELYFKKPLLL